MKKATSYQEGQRWEFKTDVAEFEKTLVIARIKQPNPEWGELEIRFEVYIKYTSLAQQSIPIGYHGVVLSLNEEGLDRSITKLVESGIKLPWWWQYAYHLESENDPGNAWLWIQPCQEVCEKLPELFQFARQFKEAARQRVKAIQRHLLKYATRVSRHSPLKTVTEAWAGIQGWFTENAPGCYLSALYPGASDSAIAAFEKSIGARLPEDFKESVRIHDGGRCSFPPNGGDFLPLDRILEQWNMYKSWQAEGQYAVDDENWSPKDIEGPIKPIFWNEKRIYITDNSGDHLTLDLDPPENGVYGQIIDHSHEVGPIRVVARSWFEFLTKVVDDLESGQYIYFEHSRELERLEPGEANDVNL